MLIATDPLSLVFIACFLFGLLFLLATSLLGNLGHGHAGSSHAGLHLGGHAPAAHAVSHVGAAHAPAHSTHITSHAPAHTNSAGHGAGAPQTSNQSAQSSWLSPLSYINITSVVLFLLGFGFLGYVFHNTARLLLPVTLIMAVLGGVVLALLLLMLISRIFGGTDVSTEQDVSDRTGLLGKVSITIPENNLGEVIYVSPGGSRKSIPARSTDGRRLERDQEVVVVNYQHGVAEVDTWERFMNEEEALDPTSPLANEDELAKLRALLEESDPRESKLALQNDLQKE
jgi:membrane protein implicated in regulation of membrane protease activity